MERHTPLIVMTLYNKEAIYTALFNAVQTKCYENCISNVKWPITKYVTFLVFQCDINLENPAHTNAGVN